MTSLLRIHAPVASAVRRFSNSASRLFALGVLLVLGSLAPINVAHAITASCNLQNQSANPVAVREFNQVTVTFDVVDQGNCAFAGGMPYTINIINGTTSGTLISPSATGTMAPGPQSITVQGSSVDGNFQLSIACQANCSTTGSLTWTVNVENVGLAYSNPVSGSTSTTVGNPVNLEVYWGGPTIPVSGATIGWAVITEPSTGATTLAPASGPTDASGLASTTFTGAVAGTYTIQASEGSGCTFCFPVTRTFTITVTTPDADTGISIGDSPDPVDPAGSITYTINAFNAGPDTASPVSWTDTLPASLLFTSITAPPGWTCSDPGVGNTGIVSCSTAGMLSGASDNFTLVTAITGPPAGGSTITNSVAISSTTPDSVPTNQNASTTTTINDDYVLVANAPTTVTIIEGDNAALSVDYTVNGAAVLNSTGWTTNSANAVMSFATVNGDGISPTYNNAVTGNVAGSYVVTVAGGCLTAAPDCPPPDVGFTVIVEDPVITPSNPSGGTATVLLSAMPITLQVTYAGPTLPSLDGTTIMWQVTSGPAGSSVSNMTSSTTGGIATINFTATQTGTYNILSCRMIFSGCGPDITNFTITVAAPGVSIAKTVTANNDADGSGGVSEGDTLTYDVVASNTGSIALTNVVVSDPILTPNSNTCASVAIAATCTLTGTYTVALADVTAGSVDNTGSVTSNELPVATTTTLSTPVNPTFILGIGKNLTGNTDPDGSLTVTEGDVLTFNVFAQNSGNATQTNVVVTDTLVTPSSNTCASLAAGATCDLFGTYTVTAADVTAGSISNTGSVTSNQIGTPTTVVLNTPVAGSPALAGVKTLDSNSDPNGNSLVDQGDTLTYSVTATNSGNVSLTNVLVSDPQLTPGSTSCAAVAVGATCILTGTHLVTAADVAAGNITNTGAIDSDQTSAASSNTVVTAVAASPAITLSKALTGNADGDGSGTVTEGDVLTYTVTTTNTGNIVLTGVVVTDPLLTPNSSTCASLAIGANCNLVGTYTVTLADVGTGSITNTASVDSNETAPNTSNTVVIAVATSPVLSVAKSLTGNADGDGSGTPTEGDVLTYTINAFNAGNVGLTNVSVSDPMLTPNAASCATLAVTVSCDLVGTYTITAADVTAGIITNTGTATSTEVTTPVTATHNLATVGSPALTVAKTLTGNADGDGSGDISPGDVLTFTVDATNSGNIGLTNVNVADALTAPSSTTCATLAVGATCSLVGTYTVTAGDAVAGTINNTGTGTATQITGSVNDALSTPVASAPALTLTKSITNNDDPDLSSSVTPGDTLTYTISAANTGNVPLTNVVVGDPLITPNSASCASVAIGASCDLVGNYTVTGADATATTIDNTASATSTEVPGPTTTTLSTPVFFIPAPNMDVVKALVGNSDPDGSGTVTEGDVLTYDVTARNIGNTTLTNVQVDDPMLTGPLTICSAISPGGTCVLTGTHVVTRNEALAGQVVNTGSAQSTEVPGPVPSNTVTTAVIGTPALSVSKTYDGFVDTDGSTTVSQGDTLNYTVTAGNIGTAILTNVVVTDAQLTPGVANCANVPVGGNCVLAGTHVVSGADFAAGNVTNTASADSAETAPATSNTVVTPVAGVPALAVAKTFDGFVDSDGSGSVTLGDTLNYTVTATNTGTTVLTGVVVADAQLTPNAANCAAVAIGATCVLAGNHVVTAADVAAGNVTNTASADSNETVPATSSTVVTPVAGTPALSVAKTYDGFVDADGSGSVTQGDTLNYTVTAANTGTTALTSVVVTDAQLSPGVANCALVPIGGNCVLAAGHVVTLADVTAGNVTNTASADSSETAPATSNTMVTPVAASPSLAVAKTFDSFLDNDGSTTITQGDTLEYTLTATNTGNVVLTNVTVQDAQLAPGSNVCATVAVGATCVLAGTHVVTAGDLAAGNVTNTGSAFSNEVGTTNSNTIVTVINGSPALVATKTFDGYTDNDGSGTLTVGDTLAYTIVAVNTGNVALTGVVVSDPQLTPGSTSCASVAVAGNCTLSGTHGVSGAEALAGNVTNTAAATSNEVGPVASNTVVTAVANSPTLSIASGDGQFGLTSTVADAPLVVTLVDGAGNPIANQAINWLATGSGTVSSGSTLTNGAGQAQVTLTFAATSGPVSITASTGGGANPVTFTATAQSGGIGIASGNNQTGPVNTTLPLPLKVVVLDPAPAGKPAGMRADALNGVPVTFTVTSGGGSVSQVTVLTDANGEAATMFTLGPVPGTQTVTATISGGASVLFSATATLARTLVIVSGDGQAAAPGSDLPLPLVVHAQDNGADAAGVPIVWTVVSGAATVTPGGATDANGLADATVTLGATTGPVSIRAERGDEPAVYVLFGANTAKLALIPGLSPEELELAIVLDEACEALAGLANPTPAQLDLLARCQDLIDSSIIDPGATQDALDQLLPGLALAMQEASFNAAQAQFQNLKARIAALRSGTQGNSFNGLALTGPGGTVSLGALAAALTQDEDPATTPSGEVGGDFQRWGFFASGTIGRGEAEAGSTRPAYDYDINGLTAGVDYRYNDKFIVGGALGYTRQDTELRGAPGQMDMSGWSVSGYATYYQDNSWYTDAVLTYGHNTFDLLRTITYTLPTPGGGSTSVSQTARSTSDGDMLEGAFTFGRDFQAGGWSIGPYGRLLYTRLDFDRIEDDMAPGAGSGLALAIDARTLTSVASEVGAKFTYAHSTDWGVVTPHLQVEWEHEFKDDPKALTARFLADPTGSTFTLSGEEIDTDYFRMSVGLSIIMQRGRSGFLIYEKTLGRNGFDQDNLGFGLRIEF